MSEEKPRAFPYAPRVTVNAKSLIPNPHRRGAEHTGLDDDELLLRVLVIVILAFLSFIFLSVGEEVESQEATVIGVISGIIAAAMAAKIWRGRRAS